MKEIRVNDKVRTTDLTSSSYERFRLETGINRGAKDHRGFFSGFHTKDSSSIKKTVSEKVILQTIGTKKDGSGVRKTEDFGDFLRSMGSIPVRSIFRNVFYRLKYKSMDLWQMLGRPMSFIMLGLSVIVG